jgi:hypothetical protein
MNVPKSWLGVMIVLILTGCAQKPSPGLTGRIVSGRMGRTQPWT